MLSSPDRSNSHNDMCPLKNCGGTSADAFDVEFKPGHFTCMSCDVSACTGCVVLCDLAECQGGFHEETGPKCEPWYLCGGPPPGDSIDGIASQALIQETAPRRAR